MVQDAFSLYMYLALSHIQELNKELEDCLIGKVFLSK